MLKPAGTESPDAGTNLVNVRDYIGMFAGPNAVKNHHKNVAVWLRSFMRHDATARYYPFSLNTTLPVALNQFRSPHAFIRTVCNVCERVTAMTFGFSKSHPERHRPESSFAAILLPAINASGRLHIHGWIRVPDAAPQTSCSIPIKTDGRRHHITVSTALATFVNALVYDDDAPFRASARYSSSFWLQHNAEHALPVGSELGNVEFAYLRKTADCELRLWAETEFMPKLVFARLHDTTCAERAARARQILNARKPMNQPTKTPTETTIAKTRLSALLMFRAPVALSAALSQLANERQMTMSALIRDLLSASMGNQ